jgi:hypothetical protein
VEDDVLEQQVEARDGPKADEECGRRADQQEEDQGLPPVGEMACLANMAPSKCHA